MLAWRVTKRKSFRRPPQAQARTSMSNVLFISSDQGRYLERCVAGRSAWSRASAGGAAAVLLVLLAAGAGAGGTTSGRSFEAAAITPA
jgi:hypothetical protein